MKLMKTLFTSVVLCGALVASSAFAEEKTAEQAVQPVVATQTEAQVAPVTVSDKIKGLSFTTSP